MAVVAVLLLVTLTLLLARYCVRACLWAGRVARLFWKTRHIPGPPGWPPLGSMLSFAVPADQIVERASWARREYGDTVRIWAGPFISVTITEPEDLEVVFCNSSLQTKPLMVYSAVVPIIGDGLVTLSGDTHRRHRKAISPSLHLDILHDFLPTFEKHARLLCEQFERHAESGEEFDAEPLIGVYSAHSICETVFSVDLTGLESECDEFVQLLLAGSEIAFQRSIRPWLSFRPVFYFSSYYNEYQKSMKFCDAFVTKMLRIKKEQLKRGRVQTDRKRKAFLDHFLTSEEAQTLTEPELLEELKTLNAAAIATSMDFVSCFIMCLSLLPEVQERLFQELDDVFGGSDRAVETADLPHLVYLESTLKETLRMFPPVFTFCREVQQDTKIPSGYVLPEGCNLGIIPYITHRNPRYFPEPDTFDMTRFLPENSHGRHPYAFIPFSAGSRNCVGQRYAMISAKLLSANILRRFRILPAADSPTKLADIKTVAGISMTLRDGAKVRVERRSR